MTFIITSKQYLKNDLNGEKSSEDMICIAKDLKTQQAALFFGVYIYIFCLDAFFIRYYNSISNMQ